MSAANTVMKNVAALSIGTVLSQILRVVYVSLLARYIGTDGFGQISTATALVALTILLVNFGFDTLMVRDIAADTSLASRYVTNVAFLRLLLTVVFVVVLALVVSQSAYSVETNLIIAIYALTYVFDSFSGIVRSVFYSFQKMEYKTVLDLSRDLLNVGISIAGIWLRWPLLAIVAVSAFASLSKLLASFLVLRWRFFRPAGGIDLQLCRRLTATALPFFALVCLSVASESLIVIILSWTGDQTAVGVYAAATIPVVTLLMLPGVYMDTILPVFAQRSRSSEAALTQAYLTSYKLMLLVGLPMGAGLMVIAQPLAALLYGPGFEQTALVMGILALQLCTMVGYVNGAYLSATNHQSIFAILRIMSTAFAAMACLFLTPQYKAVGAAVAVALAAGIDFVLYSVLCHVYVRRTLPMLTVMKVVVSIATMATVGVVTLRAGAPLVPVILLCASVYTALLLALHVLQQEEWLYINSLGPVRRLRRLYNAGRV